ncbi:MAG: hypothetical protein PHY46_05785 [Candidatus Omnitrophica bacterium]|nr:hypothetical protein [Candidatus Omnitrophota bacterium]MDD5355294.1 hypothetical protein [Candidatus Omnitrophota bacterium]
MTKIPFKSEVLKISLKKYLRSGYNLLSQAISNSLNSLIIHRGQVTIEYFILFTVIAALTVIGLSTFFPQIKQTFWNMQDAAVEAIVKAGK